MRSHRLSGIQRGLAIGLVVLTMTLAAAAPAAAITIPSQAEDPWGHLRGCLSVFFNRPVHDEFCAPSEISPEMLIEMMKTNPTSCSPCIGYLQYSWPDRLFDQVLVASLDEWPVILVAQSAPSCCPYEPPS